MTQKPSLGASPALSFGPVPGFASGFGSGLGIGSASLSGSGFAPGFGSGLGIGSASLSGSGIRGGISSKVPRPRPRPRPPVIVGKDAKLVWIETNVLNHPYNESHVTVPFANHTLSLSWQRSQHESVREKLKL